MRSKCLALVLLMLVAMFACKNDEECPAFDTGLLPWMNHYPVDRITFINQSQDTLVFSVLTFKTSVPYRFQKNRSGACHQYALLYFSDTVTRTSINFTVEKFRKEIKFSLSFQSASSGSAINNPSCFEAYYKRIENSSKEVTINGETFRDALIIDEDACGGNINKCIIVKDHGLMQFYEKSGAIWTLVE